MGNCIDYLMQYGKYTFEEKSFNDVDNLILSQLSYLKFEVIAADFGRRRKNLKLMEVFTHALREELFADERYEIPNRALFEAIAFSKRFQEMSMNYILCRTDVEKQIQFAAMVFFLNPDITYVAFRGTDETIIGWKEDFNMAFMSPVPSQLLSVEYLNKVGKKLSGGFMVGGHSKGGNLAVYAAMKCDTEVREQIQRIYTNDGPGFVKDVFSSDDYETIRDRVQKIVPQSSMIGMLLWHQGEYQVIASSGKGGMGQHDPYTWEVEEGSFVRKQDISYGRKLFNEKLNAWVEKLDEKQRSVFVETLYKIVSVTEAETLIELTDEWKENSQKMINAVKDMDADTRKMLIKMIRTIFTIKSKVK